MRKSLVACDEYLVVRTCQVFGLACGKVCLLASSALLCEPVEPFAWRAEMLMSAFGAKHVFFVNAAIVFLQWWVHVLIGACAPQGA